MEINKSCHLLLKDVYHYDITSCHYVIIKRLGYDVSNIDAHDKLKRNIQIGLMMRDNPKLTSIIRSITNSTISDYLLRNGITEDELILRQYDGVIVTRRLQETKLHIPLDYRSSFNFMLISINRQMYISYNDKGVSIKGVPYRYPQMDSMYEKIIKICDRNKYKIFKTLQEIRDEILIWGKPQLYAIPTSETKCNIFLKYYGQTQISKSMAKVIDANDIDRERYYNYYIRPFAESLVVEFA